MRNFLLNSLVTVGTGNYNFESITGNYKLVAVILGNKNYLFTKKAFVGKFDIHLLITTD